MSKSAILQICAFERETDAMKTGDGNKHDGFSDD
jgi:hypothetical protein